MERLASWIHPDVVVLTRFPDVPVHVEYFETPEAVIEEKKKLVEALKPEGILVYNHDDKKVAEVADSVSQQSIGYSRNSLSPFTASNGQIIYEEGRAVGFEFTLTHLKNACVVRVQGSLGAQHAYNYAAAIAVGSIFNVDIETAAERLKSHMPPPGRMRLLQGVNEALIIDDSYNASPLATERALATLKEVKGVRRRVAVLGDMMELGRYSVREHEKVGELAAASADVLVTIGVRSHKIASSALEHGMDKKSVIVCDSAEEATEAVNKLLQSGDLILVKGSQSVRTERVVEAMLAEPEKASELLVRQSKMWKLI
jgi:UDP-N-acetylmuramyl pentapeptide synthase